MTEEFLRGGFKKATGPIEHWLTTYHAGYWGFRSDKKNAWQNIEPGDVFLFHASNSKFLDVPTSQIREAGAGVIGMGRVGAKSTKSEPAWWEELHSDGEYPYLIHFSEIHWFGDTDAIRDAPVADKTLEEMVEEVHALGQNKITFGEMRQRTGYQIPPQGSPTNVTQPEKLFPLLVERIYGARSSGIEVFSDNTESTGRGSSIRSRSRDRNLGADGDGVQRVTYEMSVEQTMEGWLDHEHVLDTFEDELVDAEFTTGETDHSDLLAWRDDQVVLVEAKSIHEDNERVQVRKALGQLHEYYYLDVEQDDELTAKDTMTCLVLTQEPSKAYRQFLELLQEDGIYTFWVDEYDVQGFEASMAELRQLLA